MSTHTLAATPKTVHWGLFSARQTPVLTVATGDTVTIESFSGDARALPPQGSSMTVSPMHRRIIDADLKPHLAHLLTGPIAIENAAPGDTLEVRIEQIELGADWGYNIASPLSGTLAGDFDLVERTLTHIPIDRAAQTARLPFGIELALKPFFGVMGVAPPPHFGEITSIQPRRHGGNLDNRHLSAGSSLFLPVWTEGALFSCGDGHGIQGDGEVCITALETALTGTFTFIVHKQTDIPLTFPRAETPTHFISMGFHPTLDQAHEQALREMIGFIVERTNMNPTSAYQLCSLAADFAITQSVNGEKGVHGMIEKKILAQLE